MTNTTTPNYRVADPALYSFVAEYYLGGNVDIADAYRSDHAFLADIGVTLTDLTGQCDSCGTYHTYGMTFDGPEGLTHVGRDCGDNTFGQPSRKAADISAAQKLTKRKASEAANLAAAEAFLAATPGLAEALTGDHYITCDLASTLRRWGNLSPKQVELAFKIKKDEADRAEELANALPEIDVPVTDKRVQIEGKVLTVKWVDSNYGGSLKMLVQVTDNGGTYKLWGSVPSAIDPDRGDTVRFMARTEVSFKDKGFGFFSRPTKSEIVAQEA